MGYDTKAIIPFMTLPNLRSFSVVYFAGTDRTDGTFNDDTMVHLHPDNDDHEDNEYNEDDNEDNEDNEDDEYNEDNEDEPMEFPTTINAQGWSRSKPLHTPYGFIIPPQCSFVRKLKFEESGSNSDVLTRILALPTQLESLEYEMGDYLATEDFLPAAIVEAIHAHALTLERLVISFAYTFYEYTRPDIVVNDLELGMCSLTRLASLRHLGLPFISLIPEPDDKPTISAAQNPLDVLLPRSLVHLELYLDLAWRLDEFLAVTGLPQTLPRTHQALPALRRIVVKCMFTRPEDKETSQRVTAHLREGGADEIELEILHRVRNLREWGALA